MRETHFPTNRRHRRLIERHGYFKKTSAPDDTLNILHYYCITYKKFHIVLKYNMERFLYKTYCFFVKKQKREALFEKSASLWVYFHSAWKILFSISFRVGLLMSKFFFQILIVWKHTFFFHFWMIYSLGMKVYINYYFLSTLQRYCFRDFSGGPVVKTPHSQCRRHRFNSWLGNKDPACCLVWPKTNKQKIPSSSEFYHLYYRVSC